MSFFSKACDSLSEYEDDDLWKTMYKLCGPLPQLSLTFPSWRPSYRLLTFMMFIIYAVLLLAHCILLLISILLERNNFFVSVLLFEYWSVICLCVFAIISFSLPHHRKICVNNTRLLGSVIAKYSHGDIYKEERSLEIANEIWRWTLKIMTVPCFMGVGASILFFLPYWNGFNSGISYTDSGVNMNLPIPAYYPFPTDKGLNHIFVLVVQLALAVIVTSVVIAAFLLSFRVAIRLKLEYQVLNYALDTLFKRASIVYKQRNQNQKGNISRKDPKFQMCIGICLKECVVHHHKINTLLDGFEQVTRWPAGAANDACTLTVAASLLAVLNAIDAGNYEKLLLFSLTLVGSVATLFVISAIGETITSEGYELREKLYNIEWYNVDQCNKRTMLNFQVGALNPKVLKAGVNSLICLDSFAQIMNAAYSFFNLMRANMESS